MRTAASRSRRTALDSCAANFERLSTVRRGRLNCAGIVPVSASCAWLFLPNCTPAVSIVMLGHSSLYHSAAESAASGQHLVRLMSMIGARLVA
jgi:hypothetical protein